MSKPELGVKRTCVGCAVRFYDMLRSPAVCPKCDAPQPALVARVVRRPTSVMKAKAIQTQEEAADEVLVATDDDDDAPETDDDLDDDAADLPDVKDTETI